MRSTILGVGEWIPEGRRRNADWPTEVVEAWRARAAAQAKADGLDGGALSERPDLDTADQLSAAGYMRDASDVFLFTRERAVADESVTSTLAAARAGEAALENAGVEAGEVDVVMCWDAIPDRPGSPSAPKTAELVGARSAHAFDIQQACASVVSSLQLAAALVESGRARYVLLTQAHICFRFTGFDTPISANIGDLATAIVVGPSERAGILTTSLQSDGRFRDAVIFARGRDEATDTPWWTPGGPFFFGTKDRAGAQEMMRDTVRMGVTTIREACDRGGLRPEALDVVCAPHPRGWIPGAIAKTLGLREEQAPQRYEEIAHVGGCGTVANLIEARRRGLLHDGATVALYAQGQGMTRAAAIVSWGAR